MFAEIAIVVLIGTVLALAIHLVVSVMRGRGEGAEPRPRMGALGMTVYITLVLSTAVLGATSLYSVIPAGHMEGWLLWTHLGAAGIFVVAIAAAAVLWAEQSRFGAAAGPGSGRDPGQNPGNAGQAAAAAGDATDGPFHHAAPAPAPRPPALTRLGFWIIIAAGLVTLATMLVSMLDWLGADQIQAMIDIHRYSGLAVVVGMMLHLYSVCLSRFRPG